MFVDQSEIDALLAQAEAGAEPPPPAPPPAPPVIAPPPRPRSARLQRLLRIRVPVIARIGERKMTIRAIRTLSPGSIIEFTLGVEAPVDVLVNNHVIGQAVVVKVGEYFGLQISATADTFTRIQSLQR